MRASGAFAVGAVAAVCAAAALAAPPSPGDVRDCRTRAEGAKPIEEASVRNGIRVGPLTFWPSLRARTSPSMDARWRFVAKAPVLLRARTKVVLAIPARAATTAAFQAHEGGYASVVRFEACREDQPAFAYDGTVGKVTGFPFAIGLTRRSLCVPIEVWVDGRPTPIRRVLPVGRPAC